MPGNISACIIRKTNGKSWFLTKATQKYKLSTINSKQTKDQNFT